jgi:uncharacterized protein involved in outer membrane biogenesis
MNNFLVGLAAFVIAVVAALFGIPKFVDWNAYRGVFEEEATRFIGRDVRVGGSVNLKLLPTPYFSFEKVRVADSDTSTGEPFFKAESVTVWLAVAPFLRGAVEASEIELNRPTVRLVLNATGGGNWQTFTGGQSTLPFTPKDVLLQSVRITDGTLSVREASGAERVGMASINGELSTAAIEGPYRFRGAYGEGSSRSELRLGTQTPDPDGAIRFKASHKTLSNNVSIGFDGRITRLDSTPQIDGELTVQAPMMKTKAVAAGPADPPAELKAQLFADTQAFKLSDIALTFEQQNRPQALTGEASGQWANGISITTTLAAIWLDLDQLIGLGESQSPLTALLDQTEILRGLAPATARATGTVTVEQANLGREAVNGVRLAFDSNDGVLKINELKLGLPGGSRADIQGQFAAKSSSFDGVVTIRGASVSRFSTWLSGGAVAISPLHDSVFAVRSRIISGASSLTAREFTAEMGATFVAGELGYGWQGRRQVSVQLSGAQLDLGSIIPTGPASADLDLMMLLGSALPDLDASVKVQVGKVLLPGRVYDDVNADIELKDRRLAINKFRLSGEGGYSVELDGDVRDLSIKPRGTLRGVASADTLEGVAAISQLLHLPDNWMSKSLQQTASLPLRVAGSANFGVSGNEPVIISADGTLGAVRVRASARLAKGYASWQATHGDYNLVLDAADPKTILALIGSGARNPRVDTPPAASAAARSQFRAVASGIVNDGLASLITFDAPDAALSFRGSVGANDKGLRIAGDIAARAADGQQVIQLLPGWRAIDLTGIPIDGVARLDLTGEVTRLQRIAFNIATTSVTGDVTVTPIASDGAVARRRIEGRLDAGDMSVASLFAPLLQRTGKPKVMQTSIWSEEPIDFTRLEGLEGVLEVTAGQMMLDDRIGLDDVKLAVAFSPKLVEVRSIEGNGLGGRWGGAWRLEQIAGGAALSGALRVTGANLEAVWQQAGRPGGANGIFNGVMTLSGRGTTVRSVVNSGSGSGSLDLGDTTISHLSPRGIVDAVDAAMSGPATEFGVVLRQRLLAARETLRMSLSPRVVPFAVADGALRLKPLAVELVDGLVRPTFGLDLSTLDVVSTWVIEAKVRPIGSAANSAPAKTDPSRPAASAAALPAVSFLTYGRLNQLDKATTTLDSETLERELAVRKMERDLQELERIRKLDEDRAREDLARRSANPPTEGTAQPGVALDQPAGFSTVVTPSPVVAPVVAPGTPPVTTEPPAVEVKPQAPAPRPANRPRADTKPSQPIVEQLWKKALGGG